MQGQLGVVLPPGLALCFERDDRGLSAVMLCGPIIEGRSGMASGGRRASATRSVLSLEQHSLRSAARLR